MTDLLMSLEARRMAVQAKLDGSKSQTERNRMGQFATPPSLAHQILQYANTLMDGTIQIRFLDPAIGTGSFYSALLHVFLEERIARAVGYEIDRHYGKPAAELWQSTGLDVRLKDFTRAHPLAAEEKPNLLICNPPYVRHHHIAIEEKARMKARIWADCGVELSGLAGLYCYFLGLSHTWMAEGGLAGWLMPSEWMDANYGASVKRYLLDKVTLLHIHRFDPSEVQFTDALVSSCVVWFTKRTPQRGHKVRMTYGGTLQQPQLERMIPVATLRRDPKWTQYPVKETYQDRTSAVLSDFFKIKRGLATGNNRFFILSAEDIEERGLPMDFFRPILPGPRYVPSDEVVADQLGNPVLERKRFLLDCSLRDSEIYKLHPSLWAYLEEGKANGVTDGYICSHRFPWYSQENRPAAPLLCTYIGRNNKERPFRFILNHSKATAHNVYLMLYPTDLLNVAMQNDHQLKKAVWKCLNRIPTADLIGEGRVYGGGLYKLEPRELGRVRVPSLSDLLAQWPKQPYTGDRQTLF